jgi:hypothetical protein
MQMTLLLVLSLVLGVVGVLLGVTSLRLYFELLLHLPDVQDQMQEEDDLRLRGSRLRMMYRTFHR